MTGSNDPPAVWTVASVHLETSNTENMRNCEGSPEKHFILVLRMSHWENIASKMKAFPQDILL